MFCKKDQRNTAACVKWSLYITAHIMLDWRTALSFTPKTRRLVDLDPCVSVYSSSAVCVGITIIENTLYMSAVNGGGDIP